MKSKIAIFLLGILLGGVVIYFVIHQQVEDAIERYGWRDRGYVEEVEIHEEILRDPSTDHDEDDYVEYYEIEDNYAEDLLNADYRTQYAYPYENLRTSGGDRGMDEVDFPLEKALEYFTSQQDLSSFWFWGDYSSEWKPRSMSLTEEDRWINFTYPFIDRYIELDEQRPGDNFYYYETVVDMLSSRRDYINFYDGYVRFKPIIHTIIDKKKYDEDYALFVEMLLLAYDDLGDDASKYEKVDDFMFAHFVKNNARERGEAEYTTDLALLYDNFKGIVSDEALKKINEMPYPKGNHGNQYMRDYSIIWAYSFWNRRKLEGKLEEIHNLLILMKQDYSSME